ncbi:MAG: hypothetical protein QW587_04125, partial [Candidatus Bathyarchaeia archaeon]
FTMASSTRKHRTRLGLKSASRGARSCIHLHMDTWLLAARSLRALEAALRLKPSETQISPVQDNR